MIIDFENHLFLKERTQGVFKSGKICERYWDNEGKLKIRLSEDASNPEKFIQFMDEAGIDLAVLTNNGGRNLDDMKRWHDFCFEVIKKFPKRFIAFATVPPLGGKASFEELDRAVKHLGMKGVHIWTRQPDGTALDSKEMWPFYEKVSELKIPIDVHITGEPMGFDALHASYPLYYIIARELDMITSVLRICLGGVLEDFPDLIFIMNHFGGGISSIMERIDAYIDYSERPGWPNFYFDKKLITKPWREYFNKLYFNMAGREVGIETLKCALTNISPKRLLFATDWPFNFDYEPLKVKKYISEIKRLNLSQEDINDMLGGNAARLLGIDRY